MTDVLTNLLGSTEQTFFLGSLLYAACYGGDFFLTRILGASAGTQKNAASSA